MSSDITKTSHPEIFLFKAGFVAVFILLLALTVIVRIRTLATPLERDVGEYAYAGQLILEGVPPFQNTYKIPAIYYAYAVILACFGQSPSGINTAALLINTATIILLFFLAKRLFGTVAGAASAVFFAITSISNTVKATANAEIFVVLFAIAGIILLMNFAGSKKYLSLVTGAVLLGIGFTMKQHGAGFILFGFLFLLWNQVRQKPFNWKNLVFVILVYCFSAIAPFLIICLVLWHYGVLGKFWFWPIG